MPDLPLAGNPDPRDQLDPRVRAFFDDFQAAGDARDNDLLTRCFAAHFLAADPTGARPVPREAFLAALPGRAAAFAAAGIGPAVLASVTSQRLDGNYLLARTDWRAPRLDGGRPVTLSSTFLLHDDGHDLRIVLYLSHQGLEQVTAG